MMSPRALIATAFALGLAFAGCGSITTTTQDGGTTGTAGSGAGTAGTSGTAGTTGAAGTSGVAGSGGGTTGQGGIAGTSGQGGTAGASAGRGGNNNGGAGGGSVAGRGGSNNGGAGGRGGSGGATGGNGGTAVAGRGGSTGGGAGGRGGSNNGGAGGRGGTGGGGGGGPCICPTIEKPVCGVDGKTYSNDCAAACVGVAVAYQGACVTECQSSADCVHYADGVGDCCGACLPRTAPKPGMISCLVPCSQPITCPCVVGKCLATPAGGAAASQ